MRILCIGDSNTWGYNPVNGHRFEKRWTKVLSELMPDNEIIEEGVNGRTVTSIDSVFKEKCGIKGLKMILMSHKPVDYVINIHMDEENHIKLAEAINEKLRLIK